MGRRTTVVAAAMVTVAALVVGGPRRRSRRSRTAMQTQAQVVVDDITIAVPGQEPVQAWLVRPGSAKKHSQAGVLWLHWLGEINGDRNEYLSEAVTLAARASSRCCRRATSRGSRTPTARPATSPSSRTRWPRCAPPSTGSWPSGPSTLAGRPGRSRLRRHVRRAARRLRQTHLRDGAAGTGRVDGQLVRPVLARSSRAPSGMRTSRCSTDLNPVDHTARLGDHVLFQWAGRTSSSARTCATRTPPPAPTRRWSCTPPRTTSSATAPASPGWRSWRPSSVSMRGFELAWRCSHLNLEPPISRSSRPAGEALDGQLPQPLDPGEQRVHARGVHGVDVRVEVAQAEVVAGVGSRATRTR
jgi:hypothetical protein